MNEESSRAVARGRVEMMMKAGQFEVREDLEDAMAIVTASGEIDLSNAPALQSHLSDAIGHRSKVVVDLSAVTFIDSTGLGVLIGALSRSDDAGGTLRIVVDDARVLKVFEITGLTETFSIHPTLAEATSS